MRIGLTTHTFIPEIIGGREKHVEGLARELGKNHEVIVFTGSESNKIKKEERENYSIYWIPMWVLNLGGEQRYRILPKFWSLLKNEKLDLIHAHEYRHFTTSMAAIYSKLNKIPLILTVHGYILNRFYLKLLKNLYDRSLGLGTILTAKKIICISKTQEEEIRDIFNFKGIKEKVVTIPNGICLEEIKELKKESGRAVFGLGRLIRRKGFHLLVEAAKDINGKVIIAGPDYGERENLEKQIRKNNLMDKVTLLSEVSGKEKVSLFANSGVFVIPSLYEGLPTTLLEAMAYGKPVVCSDLPGIREVIKNGENGFLIKPGAVKELADKINLLLNDSKLRKKIGRNNKQKVKEYSWKEIAKKIEEVYYEVLK